MPTETLEGGFADAPVAAARAFRAAMQALARPGRIEVLAGAHPPAPLSPAAGALLLTLCDADTPLHLAGAHDRAAVREWVTFHTGAPPCAAGDATFALGGWEALQPLDAYPAGQPEFPDRAAMLIVEVDRLASEGARLTGPGVAGAAALSLPDIVPFQRNAARFPLGLDFLLTCGDRVAGLPRSTRVEAA